MMTTTETRKERLWKDEEHFTMSSEVETKVMTTMMMVIILYIAVPCALLSG